MPDPNKNKKEIKFSTVGALTGSKPTHGSIVTPFTTLTTKIAGAIGSLFGRPTAANRPGVKPLSSVSTLKPSGIQPVGVSTSSKPAGLNKTIKTVPKFDPVANRAKSNYGGWRPTSFKSIMGGFSGVREAKPQASVRNLTTGVVGFERFGTFGQTGTTRLSQVRPRQKVTASGWNKFAGPVTINQGDRRGYSLKRSSTQASLFENIVKSQKGTGYMGSTFLGKTGGHSSLVSGSSFKRDVGTGSSLYIQHANAPQFLHETLSGISGAIKGNKPTYNVSTSSGKKSTKTKPHALSADYEVYKSYMNTYFSKGKTRSTFSTVKPERVTDTWRHRQSGWGSGMRPYAFNKISQSYNTRTSSGEIPTISKYSMDLVGYDILKPPGKK